MEYYGRHQTIFTADYFERVLQSVFHTITIIAVYEIVKETFRRIELMQLRLKIREYEALAQACCLQSYGCKACVSCTELNSPCITYRAVPTSVYRSLEAKTRLWRKHPSGSTHRALSTQREIYCLNQYLQNLASYIQELKAQQDFQLRERYQRYELRRNQMAQDLMLKTLRERNLCPCGVNNSPNEPPRTLQSSQTRPQPSTRLLRIC